MTDLVPVDDQERTLQIFDMKPQAMVASATEIANVLSDVIDRQGLFANIQGNKYVKLEGWNLLGTLLGVLPRERNVTELEDGSYEATVELVSTKSGHIVGCGSAICSVTEKRWGNAEKFARRSMCVTRATAKAYRLGMSWIINLAGYEATPFEEIVDVGQPVYKNEQPKPKPDKDRTEVGHAIPDIYADTPKHKKWLAAKCKEQGITAKQTMIDMHTVLVGKSILEFDAVLADARKEMENGA